VRRLLVAAAVLSAVVFEPACGSVATPKASATGCRETRASADYRETIATARPLLRRLKAGVRAPGLSLAVAIRGKIVWSANCGYADLKSRRLVTDHTRFRIGSVSKPLTATALASFAASSRVDLDASIARYLPHFPSHGGAITLRRLAGHLAGIRHYQSQAEVINRRHFRNVAATLSLFADDPLVAEPGARFSYSSYGYDVIGAALERVADEPFAALMREQLLAPAHMAETTLASAPANVRASFYEVTSNGGVRRAPPIDLSDRLPAGGFLSTADDLAHFGAAFTDGTLVDPATEKMMFSSQRTTRGELTDYGLGFEVHPSPFGLFVRHIGAVDGGTAALLIHPQSRAVLALTTNIGYASATSAPPPKKDTPDPTALLLPFIRK
jgi:serine beta-lactamase-like protein LACTB